MAETRALARETARLRVYEVRDDATGKLLRTEEDIVVPPEDTNAAALRDKAQQALAANSAYLGMTTRTQADVAAQVVKLTRECNGIIRLLLGQFDSISDA